MALSSSVKGTLTNHKDLIHDVSYNYYGDRLATCSSDQHVKASWIFLFKLINKNIRLSYRKVCFRLILSFLFAINIMLSLRTVVMFIVWLMDHEWYSYCLLIMRNNYNINIIMIFIYVLEGECSCWYYYN